MNLAVIGGGNGGYATAADLTLRGHSVNMFEFPEFEANLKPIREKGGIQIDGTAMTGLATPKRVTTDIHEALDGVEIVIVSVPANAHKRVAETCAPYLKAGQVVFLDPGSQFGALEFANALRKSGIDVVNDVMVGETPSLYYSCRRYGAAKVWVYQTKTNLAFATFPSKNTRRALEVLYRVFPSPQLSPAASMLETSLNSLNAWHHPPYMIFNAVDIENGESIDVGPEQPGLDKVRAATSVNNTKKAMESERMAISKALGLKTVQRDMVVSETAISGSQKTAPWPAEMGQATKSKDYRGGTLKMRYLTEDIPYGLVPVASLGKMLGVPTPTLDAIITLASIINETDYRAQGRTVETLGISGMTAAQLNHYVNEGKL